MAQFNVTTTGIVGVVSIEDLHLTLTHPQTIDLINDLTDKFTWAEILESNDLQTAIDAGEVNVTDESANPITAVTLDKLATAATGIVQDAIVDGQTTIAPSQNAVFDALALKLDASAVSPFGLTLIDDVDAATARTTLGLGTAATANVVDFATAAQGALADTAVQPGDNVSDLANDAGYVDAAGAAAAAPVQSVFGRIGTVVPLASDYDDSQIDLTYTPVNFTATNAFLDGALEGLDNAFGALVGDGNDTPVVRGDAITGVAPTAFEVPSPVSGDTASVFLTNGVLEKWVFTTTWTLAYTLDANEAANLGYIASPADGTVTSSTGTDAVIPLANTTNAGLLSPADFDKLDFITVSQAVDLDTIESNLADVITLTGVPAGSTDFGTLFTGTTIPDGSDLAGALQALETAVESATGATNLSLGTITATGVEIVSSTGSNVTLPLATPTLAGLYIPADKTKVDFISVTQAVDLDVIEDQQNDLITLSGVAAGATDLGTFTGDIISDNVDNKTALQELETAIEANVYGTEFNLFQDLAVDTTTSTTFQNKITGNTTALPVGKYKILVSYSWNHNATQNDFEASFLFDGGAVGQNGSGLIHKAEPKDAGGNFSGTGSNQQYTFTQAYYVDVTVAGAKSISLDYRTSNAGVASSIWDASVEVIRVQ